MVFKRLKSILLLLSLLGIGSAKATTFMTFQSTYLGDGWFQYQINLPKDPFFTNASVFNATLEFTNLIDYVNGAEGWTFDGTEWSYTNNWRREPYTETFLMRSSNTCWRLATNPPAFMTFTANPTDTNLIRTKFFNIIGYIWPPYLTPCLPAETDGSPTNYLVVMKIIPDIVINQLMQTNGNIYGVDFTWNYDSTFVLQGSTDFNHWTNITYLWGYPPETVWTTNMPLNNFGQFFRLELVATYHSTNLPPLTSP